MAKTKHRIIVNITESKKKTTVSLKTKGISLEQLIKVYDTIGKAIGEQMEQDSIREFQEG